MTGRSPSTAGPQPVVDQLFWAGYPCGYYLPSTCLHMAGLIEEGYYRFTPPPGY